MSVSVRNPPQRRKSLGPVSPKRLYRNLSVRLRGGESNSTSESESPNRHSRATPAYKSLWEAVENEDTLAVQCLLSKDRAAGGGGEKREKREREREHEKGVNSMSEQGLVPLDVAALTHNSPLLHVLIKAGARHNPNLCRPSDWLVKLDSLVALAGQRVEECREDVLERVGAGPQGQADAQRQLRIWTLRRQLYWKMRDHFRLTVLPGPPSCVSLLVTSATSLSVSFSEPEGSGTGLVTRYRVEWSISPNFKPLCGSALVLDTKSLFYNITDLQSGVQYFVRVSAYNVKGWGPFQSSSPASAAPSSWRECVGVKVRSKQPEAGVRRLLEQIREPHYRGYCIESSRQQSPSKRLSVSRGLKQLFQSATKFVRLLQRGVYLAAVFYHKDNILVTADDQIPLVEIQSCSTSVTQDFLWFAKLSCAWQQVPWLQQALSSSLSSSSSLLQNRHSILRAVAQLQSSLGTVDLGQVYYEPLKDRHGNVLLVTLRECVPPSHTPDPPLHWIALSRMDRNRHRTPLLPEPTAVDTLNEQLKDKLSYHRRGTQRAQTGLYIGVLKLSSSVDQIRVLVSQKMPNLLCHAKVRHNHHVSREEWAWLQSLTVVGQPVIGSTEVQAVPEEFVRSLRLAVTTLLTKLSIPLYRGYQYRMYTQELLQFGDQLSMLLLLPPSEDFSASPSPRPMDWVQDPTLSLPLQIFELVHFWAYERDFLSHYCQAWVRLELDSHLSQQALREALDSKEVQEAKERLEHITQMLQSLDSMWREARWITDVLQYVRLKHIGGMAQLGRLMGGEPPIPETIPEEEEGKEFPSRKLLHPQTESVKTCGVGQLFASDRAGQVDAPGDIQPDVVAGEGASEGHGAGRGHWAPQEAAFCDFPELSAHSSAQAGAGGYNPASHCSRSDGSQSSADADVCQQLEQEDEDADGSVRVTTDIFDGLALAKPEREALSGFGNGAPKDCFSFAYEDDVGVAAGCAVLGDGICIGSRFWDPFECPPTPPLILGPPPPTAPAGVELGERVAIHTGGRTHGLPARSLVEWVSSTTEQS
ncbi:ankyrin repeat and fibronectin type-III domain-containing protein 1-like [Anguilla rostrata]|uniref:ankyrin repeat and fibronectin type-III domain-containing protein 1-like n=1 Tax=Anguilla rostrata TaxID=7938 RepID=UPI0030D260B5